jgi:hypothetical protein
MCVCLYIHVYVYTFIYTYTHVHIYTYTHIHTCIYIYTGVKGALYTFVGLIQLPYYKALGVGGRDYQIYGSVAVAPFSVKGPSKMESEKKTVKKKPYYSVS